jgi:hypothetical protein
MKNIISFIAASILLASAGHATTINLSGTFLINGTLRAANCYRLQGCVIVPNGVSLYIEPGTQIRGTSGSLYAAPPGGHY